MALRDHEKVWTHYLNLPLADYSSSLLATNSAVILLKQKLVLGGWSVVQSFAGATSSGEAATIPVVDGDSFPDDPTLVRTSTWPSWMILASPAGFCKGLDGSGLGDQSRIYLKVRHYSGTSWYIEFSRDMPTGGSSTVNPTSALGLSNNSSIFQLLNVANYVYTLIDISVATDGSFYFLSRTNLGFFEFAIDCLALADVTPVVTSAPGIEPVTTVPYPFAFFCRIKFDGSIPGASKSTNWRVGSTSAARYYGYDKAGTKVTFTIFSMTSVTGDIGYGESSTGDGFSGGQASAYMYVYADTPPYHGLVGRIPDYTLTGANLGQGAGDRPLPAPPKFCVVGHCRYPVDTLLSV